MTVIDVAVDLVVVGIGVQPATQRLEGSALQVDDGVRCHVACLALGGRPHRCAGDVSRWDQPAYGSMRIEHWTKAGEQVAHAARALVEGTDAGPFSPGPYMCSAVIVTAYAGAAVECKQGPLLPTRAHRTVTDR